MKQHTALGLMSGTSMDGVDLAGCVFYREGEKWRYSIEAAETIPYSGKWKTALAGCVNLQAFDLIKLHNDYGYYLGRLCCDFIARYDFVPGLIASHGHTVFHQPDQRLTFQLGSGSAISAETGLPVVYDFRSADIALGGQGAPLVPAGDRLLFSEFAGCLNIGGIANISYEMNGSRIAYDICPANMVLNHLANRAGMEFDKDGRMAAQGSLLLPLLRQLDGIAYYRSNAPKSLGREYIEEFFLPCLDSFDASVPDLLHTFSVHIARQIAGATSGKVGNRMLITGGGAKNSFLIKEIARVAESEVVVPHDLLIDFKEAMVFAFLGLLRMEGVPNGYASVTGALRDNRGGAVVHA